MRLIKSEIEDITPTKYTLKDVKKQIELAGRICYKSEDKITDDSCEEFVQRMINMGHMSMLEHGTIYLTVPVNEDKNGIAYYFIINPYSTVKFEDGNAYITTNYRVIIENKWGEYLKYMSEPTKNHVKRITYKFICDRGVSHEIVRHRSMSFAQESTRYCNYNKDKFDNEITYIVPTKLEDKLNPGQYTYWDDDWCDLNDYKIMYPCNNDDVDVFLQQLNSDELSYSFLIDSGWKPQEARQVLPNALKTEIIVTGFEHDWEAFIRLRSAKNAHPDIQKLANLIKENIK
nr:MAG TPA: Thymidylate synthase complementing protein [Caudoviricetes sp.]